MSILLRRLQSNPHFQKKEAPPAPAPLDTSALNAALGELIKQAAAAGAEEAVKKQPVQHAPAPKEPVSRVPEHLREFTSEPFSDTFPPPPPKARPPMPVVTMTRGADGKIKSASVGNLTFTVERDGAGRAMRLVPEE